MGTLQDHYLRATEYSARALERLYRDHPVRERSILSRLRAAGKDERHLTPIDLAVDPATAVTDQNHVGGSRAVYALANAADIDRHDVVLDLGCGIGGSARLLAYRFGCRVDGIDISRQRVREGNRLTALVRMDRLVQLKHANMLTLRVPSSSYDVLWGQGAWNHIANKRRLVMRWREALRPRGRIALDDAYLRRRPANAREQRLLAALERDFHGTVISRGEWTDIFATAGATVSRWRDSTSALIRYFRRLDASARGDVPALERRAWRNAIRAAECGLIGQLRMVAVLE